jgi:hypothetical protein
MSSLPARALPLRQPWPELILQGVKVKEYRSRATSFRGRVLLYATLNRVSPGVEHDVARKYRLDVEGLPRGVLVGTVEIYGCEPCPEGGFAWLLRKPERLKEPLRPGKAPCSAGFFFPFGKPQ